MNQYVTGKTIKELREKKGMTQLELGDKIGVSSKTISKWETGNGFPDVSILEDLSLALEVSLTELFSGETINNTNVHANMLNVKFYICPICGNAIVSIGEAMVSCHGIELKALLYEETDLEVEEVEDEVFISIDSPMTKNDYISFIAGVYSDGFDVRKMYIEGPAQTRLKRRGLKYIFYYSNRDGLYRCNFIKK